MSSILSIEMSDIQKKLVPVSQGFVFSIGDSETDSLSSSDCLSIITTQEQRAFSLLSERQRQLISGLVDGEVIARHSIAGRTEYQLTIFPLVENSIKVYVNLPVNVAWKDRKPVHQSTNYIIDLETGILTFDEPPPTDSLIVASYRHSNQAVCKWVKECVISFVVLEISRRFTFFRDSNGQERFDSWESQALGTLKDFAKSGKLGIQELDELQLIDDVRPDFYRAFFYRN